VPALELTSEEIRTLLADGRLEIQGRLAWASNATLLVTLTAGGVDLPAIYKPARGERPLWDFEHQTLSRREVATFELSDALGWDLVPETVLREGPMGPGAVQRFVDHDPDDHYFTLLDEHPDRFREFAVFDVLANNADRKSGHCLRRRDDDMIVGIDHGLTFHEEPKLRTVIWDFAGEPVPVELARDVRRALDGGFGRVGEFLTSGEHDALERRAVDLLASGRLPEPDAGHHSFPWPLV
jgi:uncharacterized repeat protein (TIGR03843 family)